MNLNHFLRVAVMTAAAIVAVSFAQRAFPAVRQITG